MPGFRPSYTLMRNKSRLYSLIPENIQLVKYGEENEKKGSTTEGDGDNKPSGDGGTTPSGNGGSISDGGGSTSGGGTDNPDGENIKM